MSKYKIVNHLQGDFAVNRRTTILLVTAVTLITLGFIAYPGQKRAQLRYILANNSAQAVSPGQNDNNKLPLPVEPRNPDNSIPENRQKVVYLTFDDGPDIINTPMILDILDTYDVKATFFVVGTNIEKYPEILKDIVEKGHALGNHTYNHRYKDIYASSGAFINSLKKNEELIFRLVGQRPNIVRDPGGEVRNSKAMKNLLAQNGYKLIDWNVDSYDSRKTNSEGEDIVESIRRQAKNQSLWPNMIVLMHDGWGHTDTVRALPTIIEMFKNQGFEFDVLH